MKVAQIIPPQWSTIFPQGDYRMVLAHWVPTSDAYVQATQRASGYTMVDTGAFEGVPVSLADLNEACRRVNADEVVLPDAIGDAKETLSRSWAALGKLDVKRLMFVPHGKTVEEVMLCLDAWLVKWNNSEFKDRYALAIGLTSGGRPPVPGRRSDVLNQIAGREPGYPIHLLGIPNIEEFLSSEVELGRELNIRGVDTSIAFALGAEDKLLTPSQPKVHLKDPSGYEALNTHQRRLILLNQGILRGWIDGPLDPAAIPTSLIRYLASSWLKYWAVGFADVETVMTACGMPKGRYALLKFRRREKHIRPLKRGEKLREHETEVKL